MVKADSGMTGAVYSTVFHLNSAPLFRAGLAPNEMTVTGLVSSTGDGDDADPGAFAASIVAAEAIATTDAKCAMVRILLMKGREARAACLPENSLREVI